MSLKSLASKVFANSIHKQNQKWVQNPVETQQRVLKTLLKKARTTSFGKDHDFESISTAADFSKRVPIRDYEGLKSYIERIIAGEENVLWKGRPVYFAKTSGTTSGAKYIPLTKESMP